jgi:hypothetical protein
VLGGLLVSICALLLLWYLEQPSVRRGIALGGTIGVTALSQAATIAFVPAATILALLSGRQRASRTWPSAGAIVGAALLGISPWAVRNYVTFDEFVPVRDGGGVITYVGNRALAETFEPSLVDDRTPFKPPWAANGLLQAVQLIDVKQNRRDLEAYAQNTIRVAAPNDYTNANEAQRDKILMRAALEFMVQHSLTTLQLIAAKIARFLYPRDLGWFHRIAPTLVGLLAVLGVAVSLSDRRVAALGLTALAYAGVYAITYPLYYRYRYPIEPVLAVLGGISVIWLVQLSGQLQARLPRAPEADAWPKATHPHRSTLDPQHSPSER